LKFHLIRCFFGISALASCSLQVDTGRNGDPSRWPIDKEKEEVDDQPLDLDGSPSGPVIQPGTGGNQPSQGSGCLAKSVTPLIGFNELCNHQGVKDKPEISSLLDYLCVRRVFDRTMQSKSCAWDGSNPNEMSKFRFVLTQVSEQSGRNYGDVVAFFVQVKTNKKLFSDRVALAFEDFAKFSSMGYYWVSGTREQTNLSNTSMYDGLTYRFALEKESYELGYHGSIRRYDLPSGMSYHVNIGQAPWTRVTHFSQISAVQPLADGTSIVMVLEDKGVDSSNGLYRRARSSAKELTFDLMTKTSLLGR
jgi:hypothetical protein